MLVNRQDAFCTGHDMVTDSLLLQRYASSQDAGAFATLSQKYAGMVYGTCLRVTNNPHDAEEIAQECFLQLARHAHEIKSSLSGWLHSVATNMSKQRVRTEVRPRAPENPAADEIRTGEELNDPTWEELKPFVDTAIEALSDDLKQPLVLHFMEGRKQQEIASILGVNQSTVSRRLEDGVRGVREALKRTGVLASVALLMSHFNAHAAVAAPPSLVASLGKLAIAGVGAGVQASGVAATAGTAAAAASGLKVGGAIAAGVAALMGAVGVYMATQAERIPAISEAECKVMTVPRSEQDGVEPFMGDWKGRRSNGSAIAAHVRARGNGRYQARLLEHLCSRDEITVLDGVLENGVIAFRSQQGYAEAMATSDGLRFSGRLAAGMTNTFEMAPVVRVSPTLGAKPPVAATVVLFDGTTLDRWRRKDGGACPWTLHEDGVLEVVPNSGCILSKETFQDHRIHIEFRTPFMPTEEGQRRGNSGVFLQGRYEVQVLDDYGAPDATNGCGAIVGGPPPTLRLCAPPMQWQTYDITFRAPRFERDDSGNMRKRQNARITVEHNGVVVQNTELQSPNPKAEQFFGTVGETQHDGAGLGLQAMCSAVQYRNVWAVKLEEFTSEQTGN